MISSVRLLEQWCGSSKAARCAVSVQARASISWRVRLPRLAVCLVSVACVVMTWSSPDAEVNSMSAQEVYAALRERDDLRNVTLTEPLDLTHEALRVRPGSSARRTILFDHVNFA